MGCGTKYSSFGGNDCGATNVFGYLKKQWFTRMETDANVENGFATIADVTKTAVLAKINAANTAPDTAIFPLSLSVDNMVDERGESIFDEGSSGATYFIDEGKRTITFEIFKVSYQYIAQFNNLRSGFWGVYLIDQDGNIQYQTDKHDVKVLPIPLQRESMSAKEVPGTPTTAPRVMVTFKLDDSFKAENTRVLNVQSLDFNALSTIDLPPLIELKSNLISANATTLVVDIKSVFGTPFEDAVVGDFAIQNLTTALSVTLTTAVESSTIPGRYTLSYASGVANNAVLKVVITKTGYFTYKANQNTITAIVP